MKVKRVRMIVTDIKEKKNISPDAEFVGKAIMMSQFSNASKEIKRKPIIHLSILFCDFFL